MSTILRDVTGSAGNPAGADVGTAPAAFVHALEASVTALARLSRPTATAFYWIGADQEPSGFELFGVAESMHRTYLQRYSRLDPLHPSRIAAEPCNVVSLASELPLPLRERSVYWQRFLNPHRVVDVIEVLVRDGSQPVAAFSLLRMMPAGPFSNEEFTRVQAVQPLLEVGLLPSVKDRRPLRARAADGAGLTHREQQIARLVRDGLSNKAIARTLALGQPTVKTHLLRMFRKLDVSSRTELVGALFF
ncbi:MULTISPECIES: helix-turn-helix transcriptional regulator [Paraburkholderia]|uniref:helix-turn-helix transcriptional regulator n=1 Tax=Paraburkholderia TaxID=1822464 RepID=UPI00036E2E3B|nr:MULTISPECIES: helix-turn-helix transcriptional regulator [Paraburkholderia]MDH6148187.1 DNA-binding CsgD family transcriptional regulator [Paraburkholderia sp. WSM4179]